MSVLWNDWISYTKNNTQPPSSSSSQQRHFVRSLLALINAKYDRYKYVTNNDSVAILTTRPDIYLPSLHTGIGFGIV